MKIEVERTMYSFIHTADLHLGSQLKGLGAYGQNLAECFRSAGAKAFEKLVSDAIERKVDFIIIAGDIFDGDYKDFSVGLEFNRQMIRLNKAGIRVYAISGNHDNESGITRRLVPPDNVKFFPTRSAGTLLDEQTGAVLHGQGYSSRAVEDNIALNYPRPQAGRFNIGVLHTSCEDTNHGTYAPCSVEQLRNHGYDYWALGHVHNAAVLCEEPHIVFPGNLQGRHIRESGAKGYVVVTVENNRVRSFEKVYCDVARWLPVEIEVPCDLEKKEYLLSYIQTRVRQESLEHEGYPLAVRIVLRGETCLNSELVSNPEQLRADIVNELLHLGENVMPEKVYVKTKEPARSEEIGEEEAGIIQQTIAVMESEEVRSMVAEELQEDLKLLQSKLPGRIPTDETILPTQEELEEIMNDAKQLAESYLIMASRGEAL